MLPMHSSPVSLISAKDPLIKPLNNKRALMVKNRIQEREREKKKKEFQSLVNTQLALDVSYSLRKLSVHFLKY